MNSIDRWNRWLEAQMIWAATYKLGKGRTAHTPESIYLARDGQPVVACGYTVAT